MFVPLTAYILVTRTCENGIFNDIFGDNCECMRDYGMCLNICGLKVTKMASRNHSEGGILLSRYKVNEIHLIEGGAHNLLKT